ncbi:MAG: flagellar biosynthesis anti-sigma factor FlgM [Deltaproteobacteria bacterium]|nr:flagellar biosynthesis anti-sigma factor FlgM [Deltaproteobacteria bacterium]MBI2229464.1 flagellar biosynthesis anti-sigma factor FlgM [Deltaproteobacteria bacterium]MBI2366551.1 flagellar biosynthesis anti-sigma factor FlgM [Deltaproteobacteria bacterium]MBI3067018.1 flagellar biosynthesis anti-sigma factor FlgM [Deltaproteobacteria bacterium]
MKITHRGPADTDLSKLVNSDKTVKPAGADADSKVKESGASARVDISPEARKMQRVAELAKKGDELRAEKIKKIKEQVEQGTYEVNSEDVAKSIVRSEVSHLLEKK